MPLKKIYLPTQCYFVTTNIVNKKWVFGKFENGIYLPNDKLCRVVINMLNNARDIFRFLLHGYIIMPDHFHTILTTAENEFSATPAGSNAENKFSATRLGVNVNTSYSNKNYIPFRVGEDLSSPSVNNISQIMKVIKGKSARQINKILGRTGQLWQHSFYEHSIRNDKDFREKLNYLHSNPLRANLVKTPDDYKYSSFRNYYLNNHSIIKVDIIEL